MSQKKIHDRILKEAHLGKRVVRLKGGDPYLFGRGGEEALFLKEHNIAFEVVPGVTSATAVANYAGIPLTHRDHNASVTLITGHRANDSHLDSIQWKNIVSIPGTIVIYMGLYNLPVICENLIKAGMSSATKVAVIEWGTLPYQRSQSGTLKDISLKVKKAKLSAPCLIVVGDVVSLKNQLNWYEKLPLFGKTVWVTRMQEKSHTFSDQLKSYGANVVELPMIQIKAPKNFIQMDHAISKIKDSDWVIFTSVYGVHTTFERIQALSKDVRMFAKTKIACVGAETAKALKNFGLISDVMPDQYESKNIVSAIEKKFGKISGQKVITFRSEIATKDLSDQLEKAGADYLDVTAYRTIPDEIGVKALKAHENVSPDYVTFTSASCVRFFVKALGKQKAKNVLKKSHIVSIGPVTSKELQLNGLKATLVAKVPDINNMTAAILQHAKGKK